MLWITASLNSQPKWMRFQGMSWSTLYALLQENGYTNLQSVSQAAWELSCPPPFPTVLQIPILDKDLSDFRSQGLLPPAPLPLPIVSQDLVSPRIGDTWIQEVGAKGSPLGLLMALTVTPLYYLCSKTAQGIRRMRYG